MCSLVEIKNHDEIYIHYLSGERGNVQKITIVGDALKNKEDDNNNVKKDVLITHKNKDVNGEDENKTIDLPVKDSEDSEQTSDRASSMGSSVTGEEPAKDLKDLKDLKSPPEDVKELPVGGGATEGGTVEVAKPVKAKVKCREMATQVEKQPMKGKGSLAKNKTGKSSTPLKPSYQMQKISFPRFNRKMLPCKVFEAEKGNTKTFDCSRICVNSGRLPRNRWHPSTVLCKQCILIWRENAQCMGF